MILVDVEDCANLSFSTCKKERISISTCNLGPSSTPKIMLAKLNEHSKIKVFSLNGVKETSFVTWNLEPIVRIARDKNEI